MKKLLLGIIGVCVVGIVVIFAGVVGGIFPSSLPFSVVRDSQQSSTPILQQGGDTSAVIEQPEQTPIPSPATVMSQAKFRISNLRLTYGLNLESEFGYITVDAENIGSKAGQGTFVLSIDGVKVDEGMFRILQPGEKITSEMTRYRVTKDGNSHCISINGVTTSFSESMEEMGSTGISNYSFSETITFVKPAIVPTESLQKEDFLISVISTRQITLTNNSEATIQVYKISMEYDSYSYIIYNGSGGGTSYGPVIRNILTSDELAILKPGQSYPKTFNRNDILAIVSCSFYIKDANTGQMLTITYPG